MSAKSELTRDKDGFLNCNYCPRIFLTEILFKNHLSNEHKRETETKVNQNQQTQTKKDEISFPNNSQSEEDCILGNLSFGSQVDLKLQSVEHQKTTHHKCSDCKKLFSGEINLKKHLLNRHPLSSSQKCRECNGAFSTRRILQSHVNIVH